MLKEGDKVPAALLRASFESSAADGNGKSSKSKTVGKGDEEAPVRVSLAELAGAGKALVLYFYPKDSTPGCTRQGQAFTAQRRAIEKAGGVVVGVSRDSIKSHCTFRDKHGLAIPLVSDPDLKLHEAFGAWGEKSLYGRKFLGTIRSTFLVKDGKVARVWPKVKVDGHVDEVLEALRDGGKKARA